MYKRKCKICGKEFESPYWKKQCCSDKCSKINAREITKRWNEIHHTDYQRAKRNGSVLCRICGEPIYRTVGRRSTTTMHDECVFKQCADILKEGKRLTGAQAQRLSARGYTITEFKEEYMNGE